ncbi:TIGR01777 family oxidoreductase [Salinibacterium sp. NK8237]|uniref:TIGR01777 family oxidoreductase n=1 Tax=Salinibacterium sp. NK8237 TaxID=2792038 RepID=UPI0018CE3ABC|nr:TIGR01777 family oxidoreductase [Salinibacterium sp. NK8237]MBH0130910.1 TIGR01777 family oxidoreductase [Salinibacterium sp. NK8237]
MAAEPVAAQSAAPPPAVQSIAVIAGASGFVGPAIAKAFREDGYDVRFIGRSAAVTWDDPAAIARLIDGSAIVVNLAGKSVNCRYTDANRNEILRSRVETTRVLREVIAAASTPPAIWINASTATIYRHSTDRPNSDDNGELGKGFSVDVARNWENELFEGDLPHTRRVALRMAIVLGDGPATNLLLRLARIGPTPTGSGRAEGHKTGGRQKFSWIHLDDVVEAIRFLRDTDTISGPVNLASPNPSDNRTLMSILRRAAGMPFGLPSWRWMLEPAMGVLRTEPELILKSRWVIPGTLTEAGFTFEHPDLEAAIGKITAR